MKNNKWFWLQLFAGEGAGAGGGAGAGASGGEGAEGGAVSGVDGVDAEHQRLRELGVPEDKLRKRANRANVKAPEGAVRTTPNAAEQAQEQVATANENPTEEKTDPTNRPKRMTWDEIKADPEYNKEIQAIVQARLRTAKDAEATLAKLAPALEVLARQHKLDPANLDYDALAKAVSDDDAFYEEMALEKGVTLEAAKRMDQQQREDARKKRAEAQTLEEQKLHDHFTKIQRQSEDLKKIFPEFDLRTELQNPTFVRLTSPGVGLSVEDAYHTIHRKEIMARGMQVTAQKTKEQISNAIQAGSMRPDESGVTGQSASVTTFDYSKASRQQRDALKAQIRAAAARGEKLYPGR